jgi:acyl carrier protein
MTHIEQKLKEYIRETTNTDVDSNTPLVENGIIDSMGVMDLIAYIQSSFQVEFTDDDLTANNFQNINTIAHLIESKDKPGSPGQAGG